MLNNRQFQHRIQLLVIQIQICLQYNRKEAKNNRKMLKLSAQIGSNPLRYHIPKSYKSHKCHILSIGQNSQLIHWNITQTTATPTYQIICSALADTDGLIDIIITPLRLITNERISYKIVCLHNDDRIRVCTLEDGLCRNISQHGLFPEKLCGIVECEVETRFILLFGEKCVYIVDSWSMKIVDVYTPKMDSFSILRKGRITPKLQLQLMDKQSKTYRIKMTQLFQQTHLDIGNWISNPTKAYKLLKSSLQKIKQQQVMTSYKKIIDIEQPQQVKQKIEQKLQEIRNRNVWGDIIDVDKYGDYQISKYLMGLEKEEPVVSNAFFIKGSQLWYFFGTSLGRVIGIPAIVRQHEQVLITNPIGEVQSPVAYLSFIQNLLLVSWQNGTFNIYTIDNLAYTIQSTLQSHKSQPNPSPLCLIPLNTNKILNQKLSSLIKYRLQIYSLAKGKLGSNLLAFQLMNNQVIVFESIYRKLTHYRGISENCRIYAVLEMDDYFGIAHSRGIDVYSQDLYERTIGYQRWVWADFGLCDHFLCKDDYNNIYGRIPGGHNLQTDLSQVNATVMFQHAQRFYRKKLDYCLPSLDLLYETFGPIQSESLSNQMYPQVHFIQRIFSERTVHSLSTDTATSIIRVKLSNVRRQKLTNSTYLLSCNLNKQLQIFLAEKDIPISKKNIENYLNVFSLFFWDEQPGLEIGVNVDHAQSKFLFRRRYTEQGIGRSFTVYFDNRLKNNLSSELITYSSVATVALLQVCSTKDIQYAQQMVNAVQYYSVRRGQGQVKAGVQTLSRLCITQSHPILKSCINILMSTSLTQMVPLHPVNDYFLLNLKNIEQTNNSLLSQTQTIWFVYLGIGFIYSNQQCDKDQVKKLIERLIKTIDVKNFQLKPDLIQIVLKIFNQGVKKWKSMILGAGALRIFLELIRVFFYYDGLASVQPDDKKFNFVFQNVPISENKKMKQQIVKTIIYLSKQFNNQFLQVIKVQALNQKPHPAYPASVVEILRQYIKAQKPQTNLVFYIELLLQCLSPMTPQLRKHVQKNVLATLQLMCSYENISFNQPSQKLSLRTDSNIYIYCLRTSTKWRTISLKDEKQSEHSIIQMSPKGTYIAFLGDKLRIWRLSSGFWSGVLGAFSQGWTFEVQGIDIKWDQKQEYITVINENPSENKCFKL